MVGDGNDGYCLIYPTASFDTHENVYKKYIKDQSNMTDAQIELFLIEYPDFDPFKD